MRRLGVLDRVLDQIVHKGVAFAPAVHTSVSVFVWLCAA